MNAKERAELNKAFKWFDKSKLELQRQARERAKTIREARLKLRY